MAGTIFVNYRRDDARDITARVRDRLALAFGDAQVFMDVANLIAGQRFDTELSRALGKTDIFLTVIGPRWQELLQARAQSDHRDFVREEIAEALRRGIVVVPVLIESTPLPKPEALPADIRDLALHQKLTVTHEQFDRDIAELVRAIRFARKSKGGSTLPLAGLAAAVPRLLGGAVGLVSRAAAWAGAACASRPLASLGAGAASVAALLAIAHASGWMAGESQSPRNKMRIAALWVADNQAASVTDARRLAVEQKKAEDEQALARRRAADAAASAEAEARKQSALQEEQRRRNAEAQARARAAAAEEARRAADAARSADEERQRQAEEKRRADLARKAEDERRQAEIAAAKAEERRRAEEAARLAEAERMRQAEEKRQADLARKTEEDRRKAEIAAAKAEEKRKSDEAARLAEGERRKQAEEKRQADLARKAEEARRRAEIAAAKAEEKRKADEAARLAAAERKRQAEEKRQADLAMKAEEERRRAEIAAAKAQEKQQADEAARLVDAERKQQADWKANAGPASTEQTDPGMERPVVVIAPPATPDTGERTALGHPEPAHKKSQRERQRDEAAPQRKVVRTAAPEPDRPRRSEPAPARRSGGGGGGGSSTVITGIR